MKTGLVQALISIGLWTPKEEWSERSSNELESDIEKRGYRDMTEGEGNGDFLFKTSEGVDSDTVGGGRLKCGRDPMLYCKLERWLRFY